VSIISLQKLKLDSIPKLFTMILNSFKCYLKWFGIVLVFRLFKDFVGLLFIEDNSFSASF